MNHVTKKLLAALFILSILTGCNTTPVKSPSTPQEEIHVTDLQIADSVVQFLLTSSATDFHDHQPPVPVNFRNVRIGYLPGNDGKKNYLICGQFLAQDKQEKDEWTFFATIKTSGYEQWIGSQAVTAFQDSSAVWDTTTDLSGALKDKLASLK